MSKSDSAPFNVRVLKALSDKQLLSLQSWNQERRSDPSLQEDAIKWLQLIMREKHERCLK